MLMLIPREEYLNRLIALKDKQIIKVVTGVRRCGKSKLLELYQQWLLAQGVEEDQIISINFEDLDFEALTDYRELHAYLKARLAKGKMTYIFLDEIQNVAEFPKVVDSLYLKDHIDLYITGSNAHMLSSEIATLISGRYMQIEMLPLSFKEYMISTGDTNDRGTKYLDYLQNSSFPYTLELKDQPDEIRNYLEGLYNTIVIKDIMNRKKITDPNMLKSILKFVFDSIGSPLSSKKIADTMTSAGRKIDARTVEKYLAALTESYIVYQAKRYSIKGKQHLKTLEKYYVVDIGLRLMLIGSRQPDAGHILEKYRVSGAGFRGDMVSMWEKLMNSRWILSRRTVREQNTFRLPYRYAMKRRWPESSDHCKQSRIIIRKSFLPWMMIRKCIMTAYAGSTREIGCLD